MSSVFQTEHPLSKRKIWKKLVENIGRTVAQGLVLGVVTAGLVFLLLRALGVGEGNMFLFIALPIFWCGAWFFIALGLHALYLQAYIRRYTYDADEQFLTIKKGVFAPTEIHVQYQKIQDVYVDQDLLDRLFGLYDVHIASATVASGMHAHIDGVDAAVAESMKGILLKKIIHPHTPEAVKARVPERAAVSAALTGTSSETYPIDTKRWIWVVLLGSLFTSAVISAFISFAIYVRLDSWRGGFGPIFVYFAVAILWFWVSLISLILWKMNFSWTFAPEYFQMNEGIFTRSETHVPYGTIQDVILSQSLLERIFGLCSVRMENAVALSGRHPRGITLPGQPLAKGRELVELFRSVSHRTQNTGL